MVRGGAGIQGSLGAAGPHHIPAAARELLTMELQGAVMAVAVGAASAPWLSHGLAGWWFMGMTFQHDMFCAIDNAVALTALLRAVSFVVADGGPE
jgi:hypothetical protein